MALFNSVEYPASMATVDLTESVIFAKLGDFLTDALPQLAGSIVQGQENRVPPPQAGDYVVFFPTRRARLRTNVGEYAPVLDKRSVTTGVEITVQVEVHGPNSADNAQVITSLWRDPYGVEFMDPVCAPLFAEEPVQFPFWNDQEQTENRWVLKLHLQANVTVSTAQEFADTLHIDLVEVDTTYPPGAP